MIGPGAPIDTNRFHVIALNSLGSCKGSTGPASVNPETGKPYRLDFPDLCVEDIAESAHHAGRAPGNRTVVHHGRALHGRHERPGLPATNPEGARHFLTISSSPNSAPFSIAIRSLQRELIVSDPAWNEGNYDDDKLAGKRHAHGA